MVPHLQRRTMHRLLIAACVSLAAGLTLLPQAASARVCVCLPCLFGTHESFVSPATSMLPAITPSQCFVARLIQPGSFAPEPGDIIVFRRGPDGAIFAKRVVAVGGQRVGMIGGVLTLDGVAVNLEPLPDYILPQGNGSAAMLCRGEVDGEGRCLVPQFLETLPNGVSYAVLDEAPDSFVDHMAEQLVPEGHVFVLGDHRDNSLDSRISPDSGGPGMVPLSDIVGTVEEISP